MLTDHEEEMERMKKTFEITIRSELVNFYLFSNLLS